MRRTFLPLASCLFLLCYAPLTSCAIWGRIRKNSKKPSSSLIFFTLPKDLSPECDAMERTVRTVEKECQVSVERIDVMRNPAAIALLNRFGSSGQQQQPPLLFHRESLQSLQGGKVSIDQVRAWAKGRVVVQRTKLVPKGSNAPAPVIVDDPSNVDRALDQSELLEDLSLTPEQREGKRLMQERTKAQQQQQQQQQQRQQ
jgi:hypothetical protein